MKTSKKVFRLVNRKKEIAVAATSQSETSDGSRARFQTGLDELIAINTKAELSAALERGVAITIDGFRKRHRLSNGGDGNMRGPDNKDLFDVLKARSELLRALKSSPTPGSAQAENRNKTKKSKEVHELQEKLRAEKALNDILQNQITAILLQLEEAQIDAGLPSAGW